MVSIGIDVSKHNGVINWSKVKAAGVRFAMIRSSYGWSTNQVDKQFKANVQGCESVGMPYGFYHYSYATNASEAVKEAKLFLSTIKGCSPEYPVVFDIEEACVVGGTDAKGVKHNGLSTAQQMDVIDAFMKELEKAGYYAMLYSSASVLTRLYRAHPARMKKYDIWVAHINARKPSYAGGYGMWQYSWKGAVNGIAGDVDMNYAYKDYPAIIKKAKLNGLSTERYKLTITVSGKTTAEKLKTELLKDGYAVTMQKV